MPRAAMCLWYDRYTSDPRFTCLHRRVSLNHLRRKRSPACLAQLQMPARGGKDPAYLPLYAAGVVWAGLLSKT